MISKTQHTISNSNCCLHTNQCLTNISIQRKFFRNLHCKNVSTSCTVGPNSYLRAYCQKDDLIKLRLYTVDTLTNTMVLIRTILQSERVQN